MQTISALNKQFGIASALRFEVGRNDLVRAVVATPLAEAHIYLHGAHVTHFQPRGQKPVLFLSREAVFLTNKAIRGGVPICFPWFGPKAGDPNAPAHGTARISEWEVTDVEKSGDGSVTLSLSLATARFRVTVGAELKMAFEVRGPLEFEAALHTYLAVGDVRQVAITGLAGTEYLDQVEAFKRKTEGTEPIRITGETDRTYLNTRSTCVVTDLAWARRLVVEKTGSDSTVVWNPWVERARAFKDLGDDEWPEFVCIETCNVKENQVKLSAGQVHVMQAAIRVEAM